MPTEYLDCNIDEAVHPQEECTKSDEKVLITKESIKTSNKSTPDDDVGYMLYIYIQFNLVIISN